jgi:hypothetical protein
MYDAVFNNAIKNSFFYHFSLDRFFEGAIFDRKKGHQPGVFGRTRLMASESIPGGIPRNGFLFLSHLPVKINPPSGPPPSAGNV